MASSGMRELIKLESKMTRAFLFYYNEEKKRLDELEKLLDYHETKYNQTDELVKKFTHNPIDGYKLIKRFTQEWKMIDRFRRQRFYSSDYEQYDRLIATVPGFVNHAELRGSIYAIIKLQETYIINVTKFVDGFNKFSQRLHVHDVFTIGYYSMMMQYYHIAKLWLEDAYHRYHTLEDNSLYPQNISHLLEGLVWSSFKCGDLKHAIYYIEKHIELRPDSVKLKSDHAWYIKHGASYTNGSLFSQNGTKSEEINLTTIGEFTRRPWLTRLNKMCRHEEEMRQEDKDRLYCTYYRPTYRFYLKPMKLEVAYDDPNIFVFHNLLSHSEVDKLIVKAREKLATAEVFSQRSGKLITADYRISKNAWFQPWDDPIVYHIYRRVGDLMNMNMVYCEPLQVANYGIGGNYESHYDHATAPHNSSIFGIYNWGNRIATMLLYLSEVEKGGDTVFVETAPGVMVAPIKGAGVFWYNLKRNGEGDNKTKHAGCPVLLGEKWIANLWIHEHGHEFLRPCLLDPTL